MRAITRLTIILVLLSLLAACGGGETVSLEADTAPDAPAQPTAAPPEEEEDVAPTPTPEPEPTQTPEPSATPTLRPTPEGIYAIVGQIKNDVSAHVLPDEDWEAAEVDMTIYLGGEVWAQERSTARVALEDYVLRVAPNTIFELLSEEQDTVSLDLSEGQMWLNVEGLEEGQTFEVRTPGAVASVRGTIFSVAALGEGVSLFSVLLGSITVTAEDTGDEVTVEAGYQTVVLPGEGVLPQAPINSTEQVKWGMAAGPNLDILVPVPGPHQRIALEGATTQPRWSYDSSIFSFTHKDPTNPNAGSTYRFFDTYSGDEIPSPAPPEAWGPAYNPAGMGLAYTQSGPDGRDEMCTVLNGGDPTCFSNGGCVVGWPWWSPDGQWIAFYASAPVDNAAVCNGLSGMGLYKIRPDGTDLMQLANTAGVYNHRNTWSPDSSQVAYVVSDIYGEQGDVYVVEADGSNPQMIYEDIQSGGLEHLAWSPDGMYLALPSADDGLWLVYPDGSDAHLLPGTEKGAPDDRYFGITWSPSPTGWPLMYRLSTKTQDDRGGLYIISEDGATPQRYTDSNGGPYWSPDGSQMGFRYFEVVDPKKGLYNTIYRLFEVVPTFWE
jgi:hypothetical protein